MYAVHRAVDGLQRRMGEVGRVVAGLQHAGRLATGLGGRCGRCLQHAFGIAPVFWVMGVVMTGGGYLLGRPAKNAAAQEPR